MKLWVALPLGGSAEHRSMAQSHAVTWWSPVLVTLARSRQDFMLGHHLLLIGNQGVGKNKVTDRMLQAPSSWWYPIAAASSQH